LGVRNSSSRLRTVVRLYDTITPLRKNTELYMAIDVRSGFGRGIQRMGAIVVAGSEPLIIRGGGWRRRWRRIPGQREDGAAGGRPAGNEGVDRGLLCYYVCGGSLA
jgi:hypothetical protein